MPRRIGWQIEYWGSWLFDWVVELIFWIPYVIRGLGWLTALIWVGLSIATFFDTYGRFGSLLSKFVDVIAATAVTGAMIVGAAYFLAWLSEKPVNWLRNQEERVGSWWQRFSEKLERMDGGWGKE